MGKRGKLYLPEFKEEANRLIHSCEEKYPVAKIARDLDVSPEALRNWVNQAEIDAGAWGAVLRRYSLRRVAFL